MKRLLALCLILSSCHAISWPDLKNQPSFEMVQPGAFGSMVPPPGPGRVGIARQGDSALSLRVDAAGRKILAANPEIGMKPLFATHRAPNLEIFHQGTSLLHVTEGLVQRCDTEGKLAAVLSHELAEMVADRELLAHPRMRQADPRPPQEVPIGNGAPSSEADLVAQLEMAQYEKQRQEARKKLVRPDPNKLARLYLEKAGFSPTDLDAVQPLLREAQKTFQLEKGIRAAEATPAWQATRQAAELKRPPEKKPPESPTPVPSVNPPAMTVTPGMPPPPPPPPEGIGTPQVVPLGAETR